WYTSQPAAYGSGRQKSITLRSLALLVSSGGSIWASAAARVGARHNWMPPSVLPLTSVFPSRERLTAKEESFAAFSAAASLHEAVLQHLIVPSWQLVISDRPSGVKSIQSISCPNPSRMANCRRVARSQIRASTELAAAMVRPSGEKATGP